MTELMHVWLVLPSFSLDCNTTISPCLCTNIRLIWYLEDEKTGVNERTADADNEPPTRYIPFNAGANECLIKGNTGLICVWWGGNEKAFCIISRAGSSFMNALVQMKRLWFEIKDVVEGGHVYTKHSRVHDMITSFSSYIMWRLYCCSPLLMQGWLGLFFSLLKPVEEQNWWIFYESLFCLSFFSRATALFCSPRSCFTNSTVTNLLFLTSVLWMIRPTLWSLFILPAVIIVRHWLERSPLHARTLGAELCRCERLLGGQVWLWTALWVMKAIKPAVTLTCQSRVVNCRLQQYPSLTYTEVVNTISISVEVSGRVAAADDCRGTKSHFSYCPGCCTTSSGC